MQKALEQMNVTLTDVVSDIAGLTGVSIIGAKQRAYIQPMSVAQPREFMGRS